MNHPLNWYVILTSGIIGGVCGGIVGKKRSETIIFSIAFGWILMLVWRVQ